MDNYKSIALKKLKNKNKPTEISYIKPVKPKKRNDIDSIGIPFLKQGVYNIDYVHDQIELFYEISTNPPNEKDASLSAELYIKQNEDLKNKFDYYVKYKNIKEEFIDLPHNDRPFINLRVPIVPNKNRNLFENEIDDYDPDKISEIERDYIDFVYDNVVWDRVKEFRIHVQVFYFLQAIEFFKTELLPYFENHDEHYPLLQQCYNSESEFKNDIIDTLYLVALISYRERNSGIVFDLQFLQTKNILSMKEFREYIVKLYNKFDIDIKSKYILDNNDNPNVNTIKIYQKTIEQYYFNYIKNFYDKEENKNTAASFMTFSDSSDEDAKAIPVKMNPYVRATQSFDINYNKKKYGLHHVGFPGTYQMDLMFSAKRNNCFLVAIEVNTRYVFITRTNVKHEVDGEFIHDQTSGFAIFYAMQKLFDQGWNPSIIKSDSEKGFISKFVRKNVYDHRGIRHQSVFRVADNYDKTQPMHTSLSIVDRFIKTLKRYFQDELGYLKGELPRDLVYQFVDYYNNERKHSTLSKILNSPTTPADVHNDFKKEVLIIRDRLRRNKEIMRRHGWYLPRGTKIKVYKGNNKFNRISAVRPEKHVVLDNLRNIYLIGNPRTGETELISRINIAKD